MSSFSRALEKATRIDISNDMTDAFYADKKIKKGSTLTFMKDNKPTHLKIVRLNRKSKKCEVIETQLYKEEEIGSLDIVDGEPV